ncbi:terminase [Citrobacter werkmanii]|uniref:terminase small subunit n=1 Tax=Citrobacter freundii complex TaxID=1344959 RepID=UPI0015E9E1D1|nr:MULTISPECIES: terminase small subunit [Citrobacter freundii complex]EKY0669150.1 terminase small subunit [Citrobacter freundii]MBQ4924375.1 terminase [Citrobacter werkmanii]MBQ4938959.1 terminase [Citrobacter werkmanii]MBQ4950465.1 terminase [Citrobacter werkmanii]MBQ4965315.1 terminase [Citrobacter werkmanii]
MAKSCKIGVTAFDKWGVEPAQRAGREVLYDVASVVRNRVENEVGKIVERGGDVDDAEFLKARIRLISAQADAQELKNARETGEVIDTAFATYALAKLSGEVGSIMDSLPLAISRKYPGMEKRYLDAIKTEVSRAMNCAANLADSIPDMAKKYIEDNQKG